MRKRGKKKCSPSQAECKATMAPLKSPGQSKAFWPGQGSASRFLSSPHTFPPMLLLTGKQSLFVIICQKAHVLTGVLGMRKHPHGAVRPQLLLHLSLSGFLGICVYTCMPGVFLKPPCPGLNRTVGHVGSGPLTTVLLASNLPSQLLP